MAITINKIKIRYALLYGLIFVRYLLPYFFIDNENGLLSSFPVLDYALVIISFFLMAIQVLFCRFHLSRTDVLLIGVYICLVVSTIVNHGQIVASVINAVQVIFICFTIKCALKDEIKIEVLLRLIRDIALLIFIANLIVTVVYPGGIPSITKQADNPYFLYGNVNLTVKYIFPGVCCSLLLDAKNHKRISVSSIIIFAGYVYLCFHIYLMATGLVAMACVLIWLFNKPIISRNARLICTVLLSVIVLFELFIVVFANEDLIGSILTLFGKEAGFSGRDALWFRCILRIKENPWLGYGALDKDTIYKLVGNRSGCHNYYLDILFQRGVLGFIPFLFFLIWPMYRSIPRIHRKAQYILLGCALSYIIMFMFEPFYNVERFHIPVFYALNILSEQRAGKNAFEAGTLDSENRQMCR